MVGRKLRFWPLLLGGILLAAAGCSDFLDGGDDDDKKVTVSADVPAALDVTWCVKVDATAAQMAAFAVRIQESSDALWAATEGQMYFRNVTLVDLSSAGQIILDNLNNRSADGGLAYTVQLAGGAWEIHLGGAYPMQALLHEMGHAEVLQDWTLDEEYDLPGSPCPVCAMDAWILGSGDGKIVYCESSNCSTTRAGCWENVILGLHTNWAHPNTYGTAPGVNITIHDN